MNLEGRYEDENGRPSERHLLIDWQEISLSPSGDFSIKLLLASDRRRIEIRSVGKAGDIQDESVMIEILRSSPSATQPAQMVRSAPSDYHLHEFSAGLYLANAVQGNSIGPEITYHPRKILHPRWSLGIDVRAAVLKSSENGRFLSTSMMPALRFSFSVFSLGFRAGFEKWFGETEPLHLVFGPTLRAAPFDLRGNEKVSKLFFELGYLRATGSQALNSGEWGVGYAF